MIVCTENRVAKERKSPASKARMMNLSGLPSISLKELLTNRTLHNPMIHAGENACGRINSETVMAKINAGRMVRTLMNAKVSLRLIMQYAVMIMQTNDAMFPVQSWKGIFPFKKIASGESPIIRASPLDMLPGRNMSYHNTNMTIREIKMVDTPGRILSLY